MLCTCSSNLASSWAMSISSSQGLMSRRMEDLATRAGFLTFFSAYCCSLSSRSQAASWSSCSSLPSRSMSSSSSSLSSVTVTAFWVGSQPRTRSSAHRISFLHHHI
uniref:Uncharacterized protein n=1 Tax=Monodon monoceros TaxID=40151 RepID=A0A8C6C0I8_MONMO